MTKRLNMVKPQMAVHQEKMQDIKQRVRRDERDYAVFRNGLFFALIFIYYVLPFSISFSV